MSAPIILMSFNRPAYLKRVLESLASQHDGLKGREVHLFQDGAVNRYSGLRYADDTAISDCILSFRALFSHGHVHASPDNIGICENFQRAETFAFRELDAPVAYFFEDDLVLGRWYVETLDRIWDLVKDRPMIGYFAAYGRHEAPTDEQMRFGGRMVELPQNWGFGLSRRHWEDMQPLLKPYFDNVVGRDYRQRNDTEITMLYIREGFYQYESSQDGAKWWATLRLGRWNAMTAACQARYIGEVGTHSNEQTFKSSNYHLTNFRDERLDGIEIPDDFTIRNAVETRRASQRLLAGLVAKHYSDFWQLRDEVRRNDADLKRTGAVITDLKRTVDELRSEVAGLPGLRIRRAALSIRRRIAKLRHRIF
jgi:hypothetical protein